MELQHRLVGRKLCIERAPASLPGAYWEDEVVVGAVRTAYADPDRGRVLVFWDHDKAQRTVAVKDLRIVGGGHDLAAATFETTTDSPDPAPPTGWARGGGEATSEPADDSPAEGDPAPEPAKPAKRTRRKTATNRTTAKKTRRRRA